MNIPDQVVFMFHVNGIREYLCFYHAALRVIENDERNIDIELREDSQGCIDCNAEVFNKQKKGL